MNIDGELPTASARLLRQIADHDQGKGVLFEADAPAPVGNYPGTLAVFNNRTFYPLTGNRLVVDDGDGHNNPVRITRAGDLWLYCHEPGRIPGDAEPLFIQATATGTVHITVKQRLHDEPGEVLTLGAGEGAIAALFSTPVATLCGLNTFPHDHRPDAKHHGIGRFPDEQLCGGCHRALHPDDQHRAFEHAQNADEQDTE